MEGQVWISVPRPPIDHLDGPVSAAGRHVKLEARCREGRLFRLGRRHEAELETVRRVVQGAEGKHHSPELVV